MYWNGWPNKRCTGNLRLIETWDVLKSELTILVENFLRRLIETWDVLKFFFTGKVGFVTND